VRVIVRDDGVGLRPQPARVHHYGLTIMHERASTLGGELRVVAPAGGGTEVVLTFVPQSVRDAGEAVDQSTAVVAAPGVPGDAPAAGPQASGEASGRA
jgi:signal transduction histidine kinase